MDGITLEYFDLPMPNHYIMSPQEGITLTTIAEAMTYDQRLFKFHEDLHDQELHFLAFRGLQRANIIQLQNRLSMCKNQSLQDGQFAKEHWGQITQLLHDYGIVSIFFSARYPHLSLMYCSKRHSRRPVYEQAPPNHQISGT